MSENQPVLPLDFNIPSGVSEIKGRDGETYLQFASHMTTFYKQTYGEHSRFFEALRDARLIGARCPSCEQVMVPAASWHCPLCNFVEMVEVELPQCGVLAATAPITVFASASFLGDAPFARGYIDIAVDAPIASFLPARLRTTTGLPRPGIFVPGIALKMVFEDKRVGSIRDMFFVPSSELTEAQLAKSPLFASELDFETPPMPAITTSPAAVAAYEQAMTDLDQLSADVERSPRAQSDLGDREHAVGFRTGGGDLGLYIAGRRIRFERGLPSTPDFVVAAQDPGVLSRWVDDGSLTDAVVEGALWLPHKAAFSLLPILDRLPRSTRRDLR